MASRVVSGVAALAAMLIASGALAGCTGTGEDTAATGESGSPTPTVSSVSPEGSPSAQASASPTSDRDGGSDGANDDDGDDGSEGSAVTVSGVVEAGVEPNCLLLRTTEDVYLLVGGDESQLVVGAKATVSGTIEPSLITTCQQGTPLRVWETQPG